MQLPKVKTVLFCFAYYCSKNCLLILLKNTRQYIFLDNLIQKSAREKLERDVQISKGVNSYIILQIWMLTGDKLETATCIAKSSHLVSRNQDIHIFRPVSIVPTFFVGSSKNS